MATFAVATATALKKVQQRVATIAKERNAMIMAIEPRPSSVTRTVDGIVGALEEKVRERIRYEYTRLDRPTAFALQYLKDRSPVASGKYRNAWFVMVNGVRTEDFSRVSAGDIVTITNDEPYSRKINVGHMKLSVPPHMVEDTAQVVNARFGNSVSARTEFITLPSGYVPKTHPRRNKPSGPMTYPALVIRAR